MLAVQYLQFEISGLLGHSHALSCLAREFLQPQNQVNISVGSCSEDSWINLLQIRMTILSSNFIEITDIECVLGNLAATQIEKIALINPPYWICPRSGLCEIRRASLILPL